jgi:hypothetical protein
MGIPSGSSAGRSTIRSYCLSQTQKHGPLKRNALVRNTSHCQAKTGSRTRACRRPGVRVPGGRPGGLACGPQLELADLRHLRNALSYRSPAITARGARDLRGVRPGSCRSERDGTLCTVLRQPLAAGAPAQQPGSGRTRRARRWRPRDVQRSRRSRACRGLAERACIEADHVHYCSDARSPPTASRGCSIPR